MSHPTNAREQARTQRRAQVDTAVPTSEQAVQNLRDLVDLGLPGYTEPDDEPFTIPRNLPPKLTAELLAWEERHQLRSQMWADDRFRLGYALGAGLAGPLLLNTDAAFSTRLAGVLRLGWGLVGLFIPPWKLVAVGRRRGLALTLEPAVTLPARACGD